jgi:tRNA dimethylallyltransferase
MIQAGIPILNHLKEWNGSGLISILGPTGSGKTRLALDWVDSKFPDQKKFPLLVSIDAVAVWRGFDIGTAKPRHSERNDYDWIGLDFLSPSQDLNVALFVEELRTKIIAAHAEKRPVLCVGGSHFYEQALLIGQSPGAASDEHFQLQLKGFTNEYLMERLLRVDSRFANKAHPNDRYRLSRFLDLTERQGLSYAELFENAKLNGLQAWLNCSRFVQGCDLSPEELSSRLSRRLDQMIQDGWMQEIHSLLDQGISATSPAFQSVGYRELLEVVQGKISQSEGTARALISHMQLAKKQRTWLRGLLKKTSDSFG